MAPAPEAAAEAAPCGRGRHDGHEYPPVVAASVARPGSFAVGSALVKALRFLVEVDLVEVDLVRLVDLFGMSVSSLLVVKWTGGRGCGWKAHELILSW